MDQNSFRLLLESLSCPSESDGYDSSLEQLLGLVQTSEVRDYQWTRDAFEPAEPGIGSISQLKLEADLYSCLLGGLLHWWQAIMGAPKPSALQRMERERALLEAWTYVCSTPEFDTRKAVAAAEAILPDLVLNGIYRIVQCSSVAMRTFTADASANSVGGNACTSNTSIINMTLQLLHWLYLQCQQSRATIRAILGEALLSISATDFLRSYKRKFGTDKGKYIQGESDMVSMVEVRSAFGKDAGNSKAHVSHLLQLLICIVSGLQVPLQCTDHAILVDLLLPLHEPNEMVEWRDQVPVIQSYHEALVRCTIKLIEKDSEGRRKGDSISQDFHATVRPLQRILRLSPSQSLLSFTIRNLLLKWPSGFQSNTPKEVLLLHELEALLGLIGALEDTSMRYDEINSILGPLLSRFSKCIGTSSDNIRSSQRALQYFKNDVILRKVFCFERSTMDGEGRETEAAVEISEKALHAILPALYRDGQLSWNPTVNKMTALALEAIQKVLGEEQFVLYCRQCIAPAKERTTPSLQEADLIGSRSVSNTQEVKPAKASVQSESEKRAMLPPRKLPPRIGSSRPAQSSVASNNQTIPGASWTTYSVSNPPPVTVTGVAPWAKKPLTADTGEQNAAIISSSKSQTEQNLISKSTTENSVTSKIDSYDAIKKYMILCNPSKSDRKSDKDRERNEGKDDDDDWNTKQAAPTPTILPTLRFHDLVFGQVLGEGAFSTVKYARHITRDKPQQEWPEFAVKIISSSKISEHSYYFSTVREIALLKVLSHPGIARLISAFRYRDSAYLVLEYASRGDLHSFLVQHGRISHLCTRFIIGEISAALCSVHDLGFVYSDLKPENILITQLGHVKLTDFGACRPVHLEAVKLIGDSKDVLAKMRDGDWRDHSQGANPMASVTHAMLTKRVENAINEGLPSGTANDKAIDSSSALFEDVVGGDTRLEGTPGYLPPEVLEDKKMKELTVLVDAWALGCLTYFCLNGRPPFFGDQEQVLTQIREYLHQASDKTKAVHFASESTAIESTTRTAESIDVDELSAIASSDMLSKLLEKDPQQRCSVAQIVHHDYLTKGVLGDETAIKPKKLMNPFALHMESPVLLPQSRGGRRKDDGDEVWARRQFSVLWAPMPADYDMGDESMHLVDNKRGSSCNSDVWLSSHRYEFTTIPEAVEDKGSVFFVK